MPEGPEAQIIVDGLNHLVKDKEILGLEILGGRYSTKGIAGLTENFSATPHLVERVWRHGKAIVFDLVDQQHIVVTLGMTGRFSLNREKHAAVEFKYDAGSFYFVDQRRFGTVRVVATGALKKTLPRIGWDPLSQEANAEEIFKHLSDDGRPIGTILLESKDFSGIGNYLRAEILYACKVSPFRTGKDLTLDEVALMCREARRICLRSYELGGNTIENFEALDGGTGKFFEEIKVYGKKKDPEGNDVRSEKTPEGRTIHWVPNVQK